MEFNFIIRYLWCFCDSWYHLSAQNFSKTIPKAILNLIKLKIHVLKQDVKVTLLRFAIFSKNWYFSKKW